MKENCYINSKEFMSDLAINPKIFLSICNIYKKPPAYFYKNSKINLFKKKKMNERKYEIFFSHIDKNNKRYKIKINFIKVIKYDNIYTTCNLFNMIFMDKN